MKSNKTVIIFLLKFFGTYAVLFVLYSFYLSKNQQKDVVFACAPITEAVANQSKFLLNTFGYDAEVEQHFDELSMKLYINNKVIARIIEGCNAISIIILFISFIVAFASSFKVTALYILFGSLLIYFFNVFRIAVIAIAFYEYPKYQDVLHDYIFPSMIYGLTFLLWVLWIKKFSNLKK